MSESTTQPGGEEREDLRRMVGWIIFLFLAAAAVIGAFIVTGVGDGSSSTPTTVAAEPLVDLSRAAAVAGEAGLEGVSVSAEGAVVTVSGTAPDRATADSALAAVAGLPGVAGVEDRIRIVAPDQGATAEGGTETADIDPDAVAAVLAANGVMDPMFSVNGESVTVEGVVESRQQARAIVAAVSELPGVAEVVDQLDVIPLLNREARVLAILRAHGVSDAGASITADGQVTIEGTYPDEDAHAAALAELEGLLYVNEIDDRLTPAVSTVDAAVEFSVDRGVVTLTGTVASEEQRQQVLDAAAAMFGAGNIVDQLQVGDVNGDALVLTGRIPAGRRAEVQAGMATLAGDLGLNLVDEVEYAELTGDQAALQEELDTALADVVINFASGSAVIPADGRAQLDSLVPLLTDVPEGTLVAVEGFTDSQGDAAANQRLSEARARAVVDYLVSQGVSPDVLRASGNGESRPVASNDTAEGRAQNRRIEFNVVV